MPDLNVCQEGKKEVVKAYLSYRREEGALTQFAQSLLDWSPKDIKINVDCKNAALSRPINEFLAELKSSSSVIFLLNDAYFRSRWCMGELQAFLAKRHSSYHGFFVACSGWLPNTDSRAFFAELEKTLVSYW